MYGSFMMRSVAFALVITACGGSHSARTTTHAKPAVDRDPDGPHHAAVTAQIQPLIDAELTSGMVVGLYDAGRMEIYGYGKGPGGKAPHGSTLFEGGQLTHIFTALVLADAVQRREVTLDTPASDLVPPGVTMPTADKLPITLKHLALNVSGLPTLPPSLEARPTAEAFAQYNEDALYRDLIHTQLIAAPGTRIHSSDYGVGLLGFLLEKKLGDVLKPRILDPLALQDTSYAPKAPERMAQGTNDDLTPVPPARFGLLRGALGITTSARDLLRLIDAELDASAGGKQTLRNAMRLTQETQLEGDGANEGLGWNVDSAGRYWQAGGTAGFRTFITFDPKTRRGIVLLSSSSVSLIDALAKRMYDVLDNIAVPTPKFADAALLAKYAGKYDFQGKQVAITAKGKRLYVEAPDEPKFRMLPISDHDFWIDPLRLVITFEQKDGKISRAIFVLGPNQISAPRVAD
jgi:CubicO group peptidase (beta-lactamase class C family)